MPYGHQQPMDYILAVAAGAAAMMLGWFLWPADERRAVRDTAISVVPGRQQAITTVTPPRIGPAPAPSGWLTGTWSRRDNGGNPASPCDLPSVVTFRSDGGYSSPLGFGRYALRADRLLLWDRVTIDVDAGEDRSHVAERTTSAVEFVSATAMLRDGSTLFRCDKAANDRTEPR